MVGRFEIIKVCMGPGVWERNVFAGKVNFAYIMRWNTMFINAVCVIFLIKLRWLKNKSLY